MNPNIKAAVMDIKSKLPASGIVDIGDRPCFMTFDPIEHSNAVGHLAAA